jgi:hypothetical protein
MHLLGHCLNQKGKEDSYFENISFGKLQLFACGPDVVIM